MKSKIHEYQKTSKKSMSKNFTIYLALILCLFASKMIAQVSSQNGEQAKQTFEERAKSIALKIEKITKEEKEALKLEIESVNTQLENNSITKEQAEEKKNKLANARAAIIEDKVAVVQEELKNLVQEKVDGKIEEEYKPNSFGFVFSKSSGKNKEKYQKRLESLDNTSEKRTTTQGVFAVGANNLVTNGAVANSDFKYNASTFMEWGITWNTRIFKNNNKFHFKYGVTGVYNRLVASDNRYFVNNNGQTTLSTYPTHLRTKDTYFKNVFVTIPLFLEFDFSKKRVDKNGNNIFKIEQGFRFGVGGFVGYNTNSKQFLSYKVNGYRINERQKGNWNVPDWNYGLSTYAGYKQYSLYLKYDLNPMFKNNSIKQNNISLGVRFDFN
jgi:hypothetical protein